MRRRAFLKKSLQTTLALAPLAQLSRSIFSFADGAPPVIIVNPSSDVRIREVKTAFQKFDYRSPMKFGGNVVKGVTLLDVEMVVENRIGKVASGHGSMTMGNVWAWPPKMVPPEQSLEAMVALGDRLAEVTRKIDLVAHPLEIMTRLESTYLDQATQLPPLAEPMPKLAVLVVASPFDAALFDAFGKVNGINCYNGLSGDYMNTDLRHYLDDQFKGEYLDHYTLRNPKPRMPLYHLVGALDPLTLADNATPLEDGLPNSLEQWIERDGLTHLKIKLNGGELTWDVNRVLGVERVTVPLQAKLGIGDWSYSLDFNERAGSVEYLLDFLKQIEEKSPSAYRRIAYIEQPTARELRSQPENRIHKAAALKPVVIDESLVDYESLLLAREWGYSGVALKACKGISHSLLMAAAAQKFNLFLCVQDLTCPGESFLISAGLTARIPTTTAIEGNGRQYAPAANKGWEERFPTVFKVTKGTIETRVLNGPGLGH
jgi:L-alanine-DL-glutamate epimerase-like enolase superfamily enzyme